MNPLGNAGARRRSNVFYGQDSGAEFSEQARDEIQKGSRQSRMNGAPGLASLQPGDDTRDERIASDRNDNASHGDNLSDEAKLAEDEEFSQHARFSGKFNGDREKFQRFMAYHDRKDNGELEPVKPQVEKDESMMT